MKRDKTLAWALMLGMAIGAGCSNPADSVTEAEVADATSEPSEAEADVNGIPFTIQPGSKIEFTGSKVTGSHDGGFREFSGQIVVQDGEIVPQQSYVEIDMDSTWSDSDRLTGHLKTPDFFNVEEFPTSKFVATNIQESTDGHTVTGNLTLHGVTKSITFPAEVEVSDDSASIQAEFFIKRFDFEIVYKGKANDLIRDEVVIRLDLKAAPEA